MSGLGLDSLYNAIFGQLGAFTSMCQYDPFYYKRRVEEELRKGRSLSAEMTAALDKWLKEGEPKPFAVGDRVISRHTPDPFAGCYNVEIAAIEGDSAFLRQYVGSGVYHSSALLSTLMRLS